MKNFLTKYVNQAIIKYLAVSYASVILNLILNVLTIKYLNLSELGKVTLGKSIFQSFDFSHFGIRFGLDRRLPAIGHLSQRVEIFGVAYISSFLFSTIFVIFWALYSYKDLLFYSTFFFAGFFSTLIMLYRVFYRAEDVKSNFINISLIVNILPIGLQIIGLYFWKISGLIWCGVFGYIISFIIIELLYGQKIRLNIIRSKTIFLNLYKSGITLFVSAIITFFSTIGDRFFIEGYWGLDVLGIFSIIMFVFSVFNIFAVNYTEMIMNKIIQTKSFKYVVLEVVKLMGVTLVLVVISYVILPYFVKWIIPNYLQYTQYMQNILFGAIPFSCLPILNHYLHSMDKRRTLLIVNVFGTVIYFASLFFILKQGPSLGNLVFIKNLFYCLMAIITFFCALKISKQQNIV